MNALLNRPYLTALLALISATLTALHVIPTALSDAYVGEIVTAILAAASGRGALVAYLAKKAASVASVDNNGSNQ